MTQDLDQAQAPEVNTNDTLVQKDLIDQGFIINAIVCANIVDLVSSVYLKLSPDELNSVESIDKKTLSNVVANRIRSYFGC